MRPFGFTLIAALLGVAIADAQQPGAPIAPAAPQGAPPASNLDRHLADWEATMSKVTNFRFEINKTITDAVFKREKKYDGVVLCMKPNFAILRLNYTADATKQDYEAFICDGKSVYQYVGSERTVTEFKIPNAANNPNGSTDNLMLDFLSGLKAKEAKQRFDLNLFKEDDYYIYLDVKPLFGKDKQDFQQLRLALYGPKTRFAYLPARVYKMNPNGDAEEWTFLNPQTNIPGISEKDFQYKPVPGFPLRQAPAGPTAPTAPPVRPGQPNANVPGSTGAPAGGAVRP